MQINVFITTTAYDSENYSISYFATDKQKRHERFQLEESKWNTMIDEHESNGEREKARGREERELKESGLCNTVAG